jgi:hypothetical protein
LLLASVILIRGALAPGVADKKLPRSAAVAGELPNQPLGWPSMIFVITQDDFSRCSSSYCLCLSVIDTELYLPCVVTYSGPPTAFVFEDTVKSALVPNRQTAVSHILRVGHISKIKPFIIRPIAIDVIDAMHRPPTCHIKPDQAVRCVFFPENFPTPILFPQYAVECHCTCEPVVPILPMAFMSKPMTAPSSPNRHAGVWIVFNQLAENVCCDHFQTPLSSEFRQVEIEAMP